MEIDISNKKKNTITLINIIYAVTAYGIWDLENCTIVKSYIYNKYATHGYK